MSDQNLLSRAKTSVHGARTGQFTISQSVLQWFFPVFENEKLQKCIQDGKKRFNLSMKRHFWLVQWSLSN
jgi:hypothetical protein